MAHRHSRFFRCYYGGILGNTTFEFLKHLWNDDHKVQLLQIVLTILTLGFSFIYSKTNDYYLYLKNKTWYVLVGLILGFFASLLGIGGVPINVALLMLCFAIPLKEATVYSIITIFFSQLSKLLTISVTTGFAQYDLGILWYIIPAAILGGFLGAKLSGLLPTDKVMVVYQLMIILVLVINVYNGVMLIW